MPRHIACLTYDFDALSLPIAKGMVSPTALSRGEFGLVGVERIHLLLADRHIPATFFVPGHTIESFPGAVTPLVEAGHEIAHHGWTHRRPNDLSLDEETEELIRGIASIRGITGTAPVGYRSPSWDLSPHTLPLLMEHGFEYDSSLMGHDYRPYRPRLGDTASLLEPATFGAETPLIEMPVSWSLDDYPHFEWSTMSNGALNPGLAHWRSVVDNWVADFDYMRETQDWGVITYTFHPFVSGRGHRMKAMAALVDHLMEAGAVFLTMAEAAREAAQIVGPPRSQPA
ncbi:polysaccharide deacetylase [Thalassobaculum sp.]|uniref:polysaccharide deacetylase family protein n=1 Tax=Thalassobaculum sp. TaxID=2022740 RepID=UPI0032EAF23A